MIDIKRIYACLADNMLAPVVKSLRREADTLDYDTRRRVENVDMLCLNYYTYGDDAMLDTIRQTILVLIDDILETRRLDARLRYEYIVKQSRPGINEQTLLEVLSEPIDCVEIDYATDAQCILLFRQIWLSGKLSQLAVQSLTDYISGPIDPFVRQIAIWAVMLRTIRYYDIRLVRLLTALDEPEAMVAIAMIMLSRNNRISADSQSLSLIEEYIARDNNQTLLTDVFGYIMRSYETERIAREFREKIFPEMLKKTQDIQNNPGGLSSLINENGFNPEWEEELRESGVIDRMQKINDMQTTGADVHYESFQAMKRIPFFGETAHWFYPFDLRHNSVAAIKGTDTERISPIADMLNLCDSDRYSLFIMLGQMGFTNMSEALSQMGLGDINDLKEMDDNPKTWQQTDRLSFNRRARFAIMNLYRFYTLAPNHSDIRSPFRALNALTVTPLIRLLPHSVLYASALELFRNSRWEQALLFFNLTAQAAALDDRHIFQKTGFCHQKAERWAEAIAEYNKSDILIPNDIWTLRHTAYCHSRLGHSREAISLYRKILSLDPARTDTVYNLAQIYIETGNPAEAKPLLYQLDYQTPGTEISRSLAYVLIMLGEHEQADKYLDRMLKAEDADTADYITAALNAFSTRPERIVELLTMAYNLIYDDDKFLALIHSESAAAIAAGLSDDQLKTLNNTINKIILEQK